MLFETILFILIIFLLLILSMIWPPDSPWAPWWRTDKKRALLVCKIAQIKSSDIIYELGSGDAAFLRTAAKEFGAKGVGIEVDPLRVFISKILVKLDGVSDQVKITRGNFFEQNLSKASVIFVYLVPKALEKLKPKLLKELKPGTKLISLKYKIDKPIIKADQQNKIYLYKI